MSLNWNASTVPDWGDLTPEQRDGAIWYTMFVDMGQITEDNYKEFSDRCRIYDALHGYNETYKFLHDPDFVKRLIGFRTNVSTKTIRQWFGRQYKHIEKERGWEKKSKKEDDRDPTGQDEPDELELDEPNVQQG